MADTGKILATAVVVLLGVAPVATAQEVATSFDQLRVLLKPGSSVTVTDASGREFKGKLRSLSSSSLELNAGDMPRHFAESEVRTISEQRHASLGTGAKWGFVVGASLGALAGIAVVSEGYSGGETAAWAIGTGAAYGGIGAGIGVGVARLIRAPRVVYAGRPTVSSRLTVSPLFVGGRKGAAVSFVF